MPNLPAIYDLMRSSPLNQRVGGGDPEHVGQVCFYNLQRHFQFGQSDRILDFGCGIGRVALQVASQPNLQATTIVGLDIMPDVVSFCRSNITSSFPNAVFELIAGNNLHYDRYLAQSDVKPLVDVESGYRGFFTKAYAFSVFTHIDIGDFAALLRFVGRLMAKDGEFLFTCFVLTEYSRAAIESKKCTFGFKHPSYESDSRVFIGNGSDRLAFIAFDIALVEKLVFEAGLVIARIEYGSWRGSGFESSLQDVVIVRQAS